MKVEQLEHHTLVRQNKLIDSTDLNGEKVMMNLEKGKYFALNEVGSRIWDLIDEPITVGEVINKLLLEYDVGTNDCEKNVFEFLGRLRDDGLICSH